jgi:hypothetical protein
MNRSRVLSGVAVVLLVAVITVVGVSAARNTDGGGPAPLPVLGAGAGRSELAAADASMTMRESGVEYRVDGDLPTLGGEADAWTLPAVELSAGEVEALADAAGVPGAATKGEGDLLWIVDEGGRALYVIDAPGLPWSAIAVSDRGPSSSSSSSSSSDPDAPVSSDAGITRECEVLDEIAPRTKEGASTTPATGPAVDLVAPDACEAPVPLVRPDDLPSLDEAERIALDLLRDTGSFVGDDPVVTSSDTGVSWSVTVAPTVDGLPVMGMGSHVEVGSEGLVLSASGWLAQPERGDSYPLVDTDEALERLRAGGGFATDATDADAGASEPALDQPAIACVDCPEPEPYVITVTGVHPALMAAGAYLVPAYVFETSSGDMPVVAVIDELLVAPDAEPVPEPGVDPTEPSEPTEPDPGSGAGSSGSAGSCSGSGSSDGLSIEACLRVDGDQVTIDIVASATNGVVRDDCGSPVVSWGDEGGTAVCDIGCVPGAAVDGPSSIKRSMSHRYAEAGRYKVAITGESNCGEPPGERATVIVEVTVG